MAPSHDPFGRDPDDSSSERPGGALPRWLVPMIVADVVIAIVLVIVLVL